jgi:hypothetical protein
VYRTDRRTADNAAATEHDILFTPKKCKQHRAHRTRLDPNVSTVPAVPSWQPVAKLRLLDELEHRHRAASVGERLERHLDLATDFDLIGVGVEVDDVGLQTHAFRQIDLRQNQR